MDGGFLQNRVTSLLWECSLTGLHQGDPLAPLLFAVAIFPLLKKVKAEVPNLLLQSFYLDDGTFVGEIANLQRAVDIVATESPHLGLTLSLSKSTIWTPNNL